MIHSARPTVSPLFSLEICFVLLDFEKWWGRTDGQTVNMYKNNDHYRGSAEWINFCARQEGKLYFFPGTSGNGIRKRVLLSLT